MDLPVFFTENLVSAGQDLQLDENASRHIVQVLRMKAGAAFLLSDGRGGWAEAALRDPFKKACRVSLIRVQRFEPRLPAIAVGISLLKNSSRLEWFLEKVTEIGVSEIIPLFCDRTERTHFRSARMHSILVSAMLQSRQSWLPRLREPVAFRDLLAGEIPPEGQTFGLIAHCGTGKKSRISAADFSGRNRVLVLIGPEGDFSAEEISAAEQRSYLPISLGETRLRSETAGVVAVALLQSLIG